MENDEKFENIVRTIKREVKLNFKIGEKLINERIGKKKVIYANMGDFLIYIWQKRPNEWVVTSRNDKVSHLNSWSCDCEREICKWLKIEKEYINAHS